MYVFLTTNIVNGLIYVGQSTYTPEKSKNYLGSGTKLKEAIIEFGKNNFVKLILRRDIDNQNFLNNLESCYTLKHKSHLPEIGYNMIVGPPTCAKMGSAMKNFETSNKVSKALTGRKLPMEHCKNIGIGLKAGGKTNNEYNRKICSDRLEVLWKNEDYIAKMEKTLFVAGYSAIPKGKYKYYNNGVKNKMFSIDDDIPEGFIKGRIFSEAQKKGGLISLICKQLA